MLLSRTQLARWRSHKSSIETRKEANMETLVVVVIVVILGAVTYRWGKQIGSRKGYGVGRARGRF